MQQFVNLLRSCRAELNFKFEYIIYEYTYIFIIYRHVNAFTIFVNTWTTTKYNHRICSTQDDRSWQKWLPGVVPMFLGRGHRTLGRKNNRYRTGRRSRERKQTITCVHITTRAVRNNERALL